MKKLRIGEKLGVALLVFVAVVALACLAFIPLRAQQSASQPTIPGGTTFLNCVLPITCSVSGQQITFNNANGPKAILAADNAGSATNTLIDSGLTFAVAANQVGALICDVYFTNASGGGLTLGVNGPGTPAQVTAGGLIYSAAATANMIASQGATWAVKHGTTTSTVTTIQFAEFRATVENGTTAGTLSLQYADVNTTGTTVLKRGTRCTFP